jgi:hypothetical protein
MLDQSHLIDSDSPLMYLSIINGIEKNKFHILVGKDGHFKHFFILASALKAAKLMDKYLVQNLNR